MFLIGEKPPEESSPPPQLFLWLPPTTERGWEEDETRVASQELLVGVTWVEPEERAGLGTGGELEMDMFILDNCK